MEKEDVRPGRLSSLRDGAAEASPPKASIPDADWRSMKDAPRDGTLIELKHSKLPGAAFLMRWDADYRWHRFIPPKRGMWVSEDGRSIWPEPEAWRPAQAMEARRAETEPGSVHDSAVTK